LVIEPAALDVASGVPDRFIVVREVAVPEDRRYDGPGETLVVLRCPELVPLQAPVMSASDRA
jgi:hypothetical protein